MIARNLARVDRFPTHHSTTPPTKATEKPNQISLTYHRQDRVLPEGCVAKMLSLACNAATLAADDPGDHRTDGARVKRTIEGGDGIGVRADIAYGIREGIPDMVGDVGSFAPIVSE